MTGRLLPYLKALFRRGRIENDLSEELRFHLQRETERNIAAGMTPEKARYAALRSFGCVDQVKEECRKLRGMQSIEASWKDLRYALRMLRKSPGFTGTATLILALGIGANGVVFSFLNAIFLRPLPFKNPDEIAVIQALKMEPPTFLEL